MPSSPGSFTICVTRALAYLSRIAVISSPMTPRSLVSLARIDCSSAIVSRNFAISSSSSDTSQSSEATQGHVEDVIRLLFGELERCGHQRNARRPSVVRSADRRDDEIEHVDRLEQALDDVGPRLGLAQAELRSPRHDFDLVRDVVRQRLGKR